MTINQRKLIETEVSQKTRKIPAGDRPVLPKINRGCHDAVFFSVAMEKYREGKAEEARLLLDRCLRTEPELGDSLFHRCNEFAARKSNVHAFNEDVFLLCFVIENAKRDSEAYCLARSILLPKAGVSNVGMLEDGRRIQRFRGDLLRLEERLPIYNNSFNFYYSADVEPLPREEASRRFVLDRMDLIQVAEEWQEKILERSEFRGAFVRLPNSAFVDTNLFRPIATRKRFDVCIITRFEEYNKRISLTLDVIQNSPTIDFVMLVHSGNRRRYEKRIAELENLTIFNDLPHEDVNRVLNESRISLVLSREDGAPRCILESMAAGIPVLATQDLMAGKSFFSPASGRIVETEEVKSSITRMLDEVNRFNPRPWVLSRWGKKKATAALIAAIAEAADCPVKELVYC